VLVPGEPMLPEPCAGADVAAPSPLVPGVLGELLDD
jgi:hypothetical protein